MSYMTPSACLYQTKLAMAVMEKKEQTINNFKQQGNTMQYNNPSYVDNEQQYNNITTTTGNDTCIAVNYSSKTKNTELISSVSREKFCA